jgi:hypothetical protein
MHPRMEFCFFGQSKRAPYVRTHFTWTSQVWNSAQNQYTSIIIA